MMDSDDTSFWSGAGYTLASIVSLYVIADILPLGEYDVAKTGFFETDIAKVVGLAVAGPVAFVSLVNLWDALPSYRRR